MNAEETTMKNPCINVWNPDGGAGGSPWEPRCEYPTGACKETPSPLKGRPELLDPDVLIRDAIHYQKGALKYPERNWEKGLPLSLALGACLRHIFKWWSDRRSGLRDVEDHLAAARFWLAALMYYERHMGTGLPCSLDDLTRPTPTEASYESDQ